jgi:hypothetical protein
MPIFIAEELKETVGGRVAALTRSRQGATVTRPP